jgi:hypothetical protein
VPRGLADVVRALWVVEVAAGLDRPVAQLVPPDGHADLIIGPGEQLMAGGASSRADTLSLEPGSRYLGARLWPGSSTW